MKKALLLLILSSLVVAATSCKTKEVPGRVRAPRHCNTCTKFSHAPEAETAPLVSHEA